MADTRSLGGRAHRGVRVQVPPWSLLDATLSCGFKHWPSEGWLASSTLAWGTGGCLADFERWVYEARLAGSTPARPAPDAGDARRDGHRPRNAVEVGSRPTAGSRLLKTSDRTAPAVGCNPTLTQVRLLPASLIASGVAQTVRASR